MILLLATVIAAPVIATDNSPLRETFDKRYQEVIEKASRGKLSDSAATQARELHLAVKKDLIYLDAQIQAYQLEVKETSGERQDKAVQHIIDLSAKRERLLIGAIGKLDRMSEGKTTDIPVASTVEQGRLDADQSYHPQGSGSISISVDPEDITDPTWD